MSGSAGKRPSVGMDVSLAKRKTSNYRDIPASDIVSRFGKEKLIEKCEILIHRNVARLPLLEARDLVNSACRNSIEAKLNHGQSSSAAIELVEYFEVNHDGVRMEEFCVFVENQAGKSSNQLLKFAEELRDCIIQLALASHGPSEHTHESEPSSSQLTTNEAKVKANPNPFLPPEFPPTGSSAAQGPPSQLLLGPSPGMPLPMPPQAPGTFPPGMGVPSGFRSQPMSVSQPLWGIPPTSKVSLAPSVSTEQVNPNPFLPPQFPPTGSSAARGTPSQPLLGPCPGIPLPMPPQVPEAFPPGVGVPPGFRSQPVSVSQPFWGIPPTSTVPLAPSVSTEQGPLDSPHIHRLRDHLFKRYKTFKVGGGGKKMEFVQLAVLKGQVNVPKDEKEICDKLAFLQRFRNFGKKERQIAGYIDAFDLLHKSSHRIRVVYGQPGIGKTTLLTHVCRALAMKEADSEYALVLYFPLRNKKVSGAKTLKELLSYFDPVDDDKLDLSEVKQVLVNSEDKQILFIFDGADEVRDWLSVPDSNAIQKILAGNTLPQANVIVSSRPGSLPFLQPHSSSFCEIHGFDQASIERYVEDFFKGTPEKAEKMIKELHSRPDLLGGAQIPMNLFIYCSVYDYSGLPPTMTECHKKFLCNVVKREYKKCGVPCQVDPSLSQMSPEVKGLFKSLGALAYEGMMKNPPVFVFDESDIRRAFPTLPPEAVVEESIFKGLLVQHSCTVGYEEVNTFNFSHTTNHEFFVAWHISHPKANQLQFVREHFSDPKFAVVVRFYSGLTGLSTPGVASLLCQSVSARSTSSVSSPATSFSLPSECSNRDPSLLYLFHSLYESQNSKFTQNIVHHLNQSLVFYLFLTPHDTLAIAHCLRKCTHLKKLVFSRVKLPPSSLPHVCTILKANSHLLSLRLPVEHLSSTDATALVSGTAVEELNLGVGETTLSALSAIFHSRTVKELTLNISSLSKDRDSGKEKQDLSNSVSENTTLRKLVLHNSSDFMTAVLHAVAASATIEDLEVHGGEHDVAEALAKCVVNAKLRRVEMVGLPPLPVMNGLTTRAVPLEELGIWYSHWRKDGEYLKAVERTVAKIRVVRKLVLFECPSDYKEAVLHGVAASATIEDLEVHGHPGGGEHDVAEALAECVVNSKLRRVEMWFLPTLPVMKALTAREVPLEELVIMDPPWRKDGEYLKEVERTVAKIRVVRKLVLRCSSDFVTAVLHGVAASATIEDLEVHSHPGGGEHDVAEALAKCVVNSKLRRVAMWSLPPLPVMKGLTTREVPLEELVISPHWWRDTVLSEDHLKEMEKSAAKIRVRKVDYDVRWNPAMCDAVSSGLGENKCLQEVTLRGVPKEKKQFVRSKLSSMKTLTIN